MQAIKNALHSASSKDAPEHTGSGSSGHGAHSIKDESSTYGNNNTSSYGNNNTTGSGVERAVGSTTGDSGRTGLTSIDDYNQSERSRFDNSGSDRSGVHNTGTHGTGSHSTGSGIASGLTSGSSTNAPATRGTGLNESSYSSDANTGTGRSTAGLSHLDHTTGHDHSIASKFDPTGANVTHDHKHLQHVVHADHRTVEVEEVERQREVDRHVHHVQHHVQPVLDKQVRDEVHHTNAVPVTEIREKHSSTDEDRGLFRGLASQHKDSESHRAKERTVVDLGEKVHENVHHHVHHVTQPVIEQEVVDRHRIHTVIPVHHTTHEAPIIHKSSTHEPVAMSDFLQGGGKLGSGITHENAGVLNTGECVREVDGMGEKLASELHLGSGHSGIGSGSTHASPVTGSHHSSSNDGKYVSNDGDRHSSKIAQAVDNATPSHGRVGSTDRV